jgi:hypothetical protein
VDETRTPDEPKGPEADAQGEGMAIISRAVGGDDEAQGKLIGLMGDPDVGREIVDLFGDLQRFSEQTILGTLAGENQLVRKSITKKMDAIAAGLAGADPTPIERLLAERAAFCWLVLWKYEHHLANATDLAAKREEFHHRRIDAAHRRYLSSLRTLAQIRKLALPAVQVNIGGNQVNVAGP